MTADPLRELRFALSEADSGTLPAFLRERIFTATMAQRPPGRPIDAPGRIAGAEVFSRAGSRVRTLLAELEPHDWHRTALRGLDTQQLVGHLIGVEEDFAHTLEGSEAAAAADHVGSTQNRASAQYGREPADTLRDWAAALERTIALVQGANDPGRSVTFHGLTLGLESILVVRAFELWTHEEDIRRAVGRSRPDPDPEVLSRMTELAVPLLPAGVAASGWQIDKTARLVLTGPGGGAWDVPLAGSPRRATPRSRHDVHITVDAAAFCRVVANRADLATSEAAVRGDQEVASAVFAGAAALALD